MTFDAKPSGYLYVLSSMSAWTIVDAFVLTPAAKQRIVNRRKRRCGAAPHKLLDFNYKQV